MFSSATVAALVSLIGVTDQEPQTAVDVPVASAPVEAEVAPATTVESSDCCSGSCNCCTCDKDAKAEAEPAEKAEVETASRPEPKFAVGEIVSANGEKLRIKSAFYDGDEWKYKAEAVASTPVYSSSTGSIASGFYDGTSKWDYPGDIAQHLLNHPNHQFSYSQVAGKSKDELEAMHDAHHDQMSGVSGQSVGAYRVTSPGLLSYPMFQSSGRSSYCPSGRCPFQ